MGKANCLLGHNYGKIINMKIRNKSTPLHCFTLVKYQLHINLYSHINHSLIYTNILSRSKKFLMSDGGQWPVQLYERDSIGTESLKRKST